MGWTEWYIIGTLCIQWYICLEGNRLISLEKASSGVITSGHYICVKQWKMVLLAKLFSIALKLSTTLWYPTFVLKVHLIFTALREHTSFFFLYYISNLSKYRHTCYSCTWKWDSCVTWFSWAHRHSASLLCQLSFSVYSPAHSLLFRAGVLSQLRLNRKTTLQ